MKKRFKKVVAVVSAIAIAVAGMTFSPAKNVSAATALVGDQWTTVGSWELFAAVADWANGAAMSYDGTGTEFGDLAVTVTTSANGVEWGLQMG